MHQDVYKNVLVIDLLIFLLKNWELHKYLLVGKWLNKIWDANILEYCTAINKNKESSHVVI